MRRMKAAEVVLDYNLYPRQQVDAHHLREMREAHKAGTEFPPIIIDKKSKRCADGFHRVLTALKEDGEGAEIDVIEKTYRSEKAIFLDAMRYNANHGRALNSFDRAHAILVAGNLGIEDKAIAGALSVTLDRVESLRVTKSAKSNGDLMPIKRTIRHMAGKKLTRPQVEANKKLGGMEPLFYVNQLCLLIETDLIDKENEQLVEGMKRLHGLLENALVA